MHRIIERLMLAAFEEWMDGGTVALQQLEAWAIGAEEVPWEIATAAVKRGVPFDWWPRVAPPPRLGKASGKSRKRSVYSGSMEAAPEKIKRRRGRPALNPHPALAEAARNGKPLDLWAEKVAKVNAHTMASWVMGRYRCPDGEKARIERLTEGRVKGADFDAAYERFHSKAKWRTASRRPNPQGIRAPAWLTFFYCIT